MCVYIRVVCVCVCVCCVDVYQMCAPSHCISPPPPAPSYCMVPVPHHLHCPCTLTLYVHPPTSLSPEDVLHMRAAARTE